MSTIKNTEFEFIHYKGTMGFVPNPVTIQPKASSY